MNDGISAPVPIRRAFASSHIHGGPNYWKYLYERKVNPKQRHEHKHGMALGLRLQLTLERSAAPALEEPSRLDNSAQLGKLG